MNRRPVGIALAYSSVRLFSELSKDGILAVPNTAQPVQAYRRPGPGSRPGLKIWTQNRSSFEQQLSKSRCDNACTGLFRFTYLKFYTLNALKTAS